MNDADLGVALATLAEGGVVAAATETFFGLLADARRSDAIARIFSLKGREEGKGVSLLLSRREEWPRLVTEIPQLAARLADRFWPGPLSIALPARPDLDRRLVVDGSVAVRIAGPSDAAALVAAFGSALTATSANASGQPPCTTSTEVERAFSGALAAGDLLAVPGRAPGGAGSTLVAVATDRVRVIRSGRIEEAALRTLVPSSALG